MIPQDWITSAGDRLRGRVKRTPVTYDDALDCFMKWENQQETGSFKLRGAMNKVLTLQPWEREQGLVAASAGNHGQGVAVAARLMDTRAVIFASEHAVATKLEAMRALGAEVRLVPGGYEQAEAAGIQFATQQGKTWISPYNDAQVIAGQATVGLELMDEIPADELEAVVVPVGGGGLIAGIGLVLNRLPAGHRPRLIGVQSEASPYFHALYQQGSQDGVVERESLADGLAGRVEDGAITIPLVRSLVDEIVLVSEEEIEQAIAAAWQRYAAVIEGSAAVTLAAALSGKFAQRPAALIISGGNIQPEIHQSILQRWSQGGSSPR
ncbi:threonine dehydratase [Longilinea arvoryzae]|uniref:threonine ammonia-lyase n=1 Tax=Longilinea arvoryzae TaxID=360412 RepID=A0A0S7BIQ2_9CHLR|nr:pyridoxal-phosphate dependent enzyme [Longilinea arvoryzae]GAP14232.1 threonine dehydratase [Longilinea arvoryzae]